MASSELEQKLARQQERIQKLSIGDESTNGVHEEHVEHNGSISSSVDNELKNKLCRRQDINDGKEVGQIAAAPKSIYAEFHEFSRKQIKSYQQSFKKYDENGDGFLDFEELKRMMEKLGAPQTHLALKQMIREIDEDKDGRINLREFLLVFRKAAAGELAEDSGLSALAALTEVDVHEAGVHGAKDFFEAKIEKLTKGSAFEEEIKAEQAERRREAEEKKQRHQEFRSKQAVFLQQ